MNIILMLHLIAVSLSGALFFTRTISSLLGAHWPHLRIIRSISYGIDTILLCAAIYLWVSLPSGAIENGWLYVKLVLVFLYIASGFVAMRQNNKKPIRILFILFAAFCYINIIGIAISRNPIGWLSLM